MSYVSKSTTSTTVIVWTICVQKGVEDCGDSKSIFCSELSFMNMTLR